MAGAVTPDVFVVDKLTGRILDTQIGGKEVVITANAGGGVSRATGINHQAPAISPTEVARIVGLVSRVETHYRKPVDIEWAIAGDKLYLLQARPITTYLPLPAEMITAPGEPKRLYSNSTLIEQGIQEPLSVLGTDFLGHVLEQVGGPVARGAIGPGGITFTAGGGYYMNVSYAMMLGLKSAALAPGNFADPRIMAILDSIDMKQYTRGELSPRLKAHRGKMIFKLLPMAQVGAGSLLETRPRVERISICPAGREPSDWMPSLARGCPCTNKPSHSPDCCNSSMETTASR